MVLDTSALLALLLDEPEAEEFRAAVEEDATRLVSAANLLEAALVIEVRKGEPGGRELDALIQKAEVVVVPVDAEHGDRADFVPIDGESVLEPALDQLHAGPAQTKFPKENPLNLLESSKAGSSIQRSHILSCDPAARFNKIHFGGVGEPLEGVKQPSRFFPVVFCHNRGHECRATTLGHATLHKAASDVVDQKFSNCLVSGLQTRTSHEGVSHRLVYATIHFESVAIATQPRTQHFSSV